MKHSIEQYPKFKDFDNSQLNEYQIEIRNNQKKYKYGKTKTCTKCHKKLPIKEFYIKDKYTGKRSGYCRDCQMREANVLEIGKLRFADKILKKGFRRCSVCKEIKPLTEYSKSKSGYGGYSNNCYECSNRLHSEFLQKQKEIIGGFYVKQYVLSKYGVRISDDEIENYRHEIRENRKPKYFIDDKSFITIRDFARYIERKYGNPITMTEKRIMKGKTEDECKLTESEMRSLAYTKGKIKVTDTISGKTFDFKNTRDKRLLKMFSTSAITKAIKTGEPTRITKLSKYKNPCTIERI
jgi:hypothetical protein